MVLGLEPAFDLVEADLAEDAHPVIDISSKVKVRGFGRPVIFLLLLCGEASCDSLALLGLSLSCEEKGLFASAPDCEGSNRAWLQDAVGLSDLVLRTVDQLEHQV